MYGFLMQDWVTIRGSAATDVIQSESEWLALPSFQDIVFWLDVREVTPPATSLVMNFDTSPTKDDVLFQSMAATGNLTTAITPYVSAGALPRVILGGSPTPNVPLATWVRWRLHPVGAGTWDITFRLLAAANMVGRSQPMLTAGQSPHAAVPLSPYSQPQGMPRLANR